MPKDSDQLVPVWTLTTTESSRVPALAADETLTPERLTQLRSALAMLADSPVVTLEAHPLRGDVDRSRGVTLDAASPLARELANLVSATSQTAARAASPAATSEVLYKMVVPARTAAQIGKSFVKPMQAKGVADGIHGALTSGGKIVGQATFVPVVTTTGVAATAGAAGGAAGTAAVGLTIGGALTAAAPLVLMAVAVAATAHADHQRQLAIEHVTELLEKLHSDVLDNERSDLNGCTDAIDKATSILLDQGKVGAALGLDSAVHEINTAIARAKDRVGKWEKVLDNFGDQPVELEIVKKSFPGVEGVDGEFRAHLELASLAIALKRRVIVLQAVDQSQADPNNPFGNFVAALKADQRRVDELESRVATVLLRLSTLRLRSPGGLMDRFMPRSEVNSLVNAVYRLRELGDGVQPGAPASDVTIEIVKHADGSLQVLPPVSV